MSGVAIAKNQRFWNELESMTDERLCQKLTQTEIARWYDLIIYTANVRGNTAMAKKFEAERDAVLQIKEEDHG